jgi:hypothetical protein
MLHIIEVETILTEISVGKLALMIPSITRQGLKIYNRAGDKNPNGLGRNFWSNTPKNATNNIGSITL